MSAMHGTVRPALLSEFDEVLRLSADAFADEAVALSLWHILDGSPHSEAASETTEDSDLVSRRLHAVASATPARHPDQGHMFLSSMATHPTFRGQGAGAAMLDYGIEQAEAHELPEDGPVLQPMWRRQPC